MPIMCIENYLSDDILCSNWVIRHFLLAYITYRGLSFYGGYYFLQELMATLVVWTSTYVESKVLS